MLVRAGRVVLATDFGLGPYVGQMRALLAAALPGRPIIDLIHDLPPFRPDLAAYLLPALMRDLPGGCLYLCIVDPGVGGARAALLVEVGGDWLIGPDNGLLALVARRPGGRVFRLDWRPEWMSDSFHGRDLFVPLAVRGVLGADIGAVPIPSGAITGAEWPDERATIIYRDHYGNLMTGLRCAERGERQSLRVAGRTLPYARTFCEVGVGEAFWYRNAFGLVELAVNQGRADAVLGAAIGDPVERIYQSSRK
jgi:S-adenosylmethionine hydrolase